MKKLLLPLVFILSALLLCSCNVNEMSSLNAFAKPFTGIYECEKLTMGGDDVLNKFQYIDLELKRGGAFTLTYRTAEGGEGEVGGEYRMDEEKDELVFTKRTLFRTVEHRFAYRRGVIFADLNYRGNLLHAEFHML